MKLKSIAPGYLGIHGQFALTHAEVEPVQNIERNQWLKHMVVLAKETRQKRRSAMSKNAQVRLLLILLIPIVLIYCMSYSACNLLMRIRTFMNFCNWNNYEVDCTWTSWKSWSACTKSCGGGTRTKGRIKSVTETYGGTCKGNATETQFCNEQKCPGKNASHHLDNTCIKILKVLYYLNV